MQDLDTAPNEFTLYLKKGDFVCEVTLTGMGSGKGKTAVRLN